METDSYKAIYNSAIKLLTRKDYSRYKLSQKLKDKGYDSLDIEPVIEELVEKKYLREDYYREARIKGLLRKNYGSHYIIQKLAEEHLSCNNQDIEEICKEIGISAEQQVTELAEKKLRSLKSTLTSFEKEVKIMSLLQNKGHDLDVARTIVSNLLK